MATEDKWVILFLGVSSRREFRIPCILEHHWGRTFGNKSHKQNISYLNPSTAVAWHIWFLSSFFESLSVYATELLPERGKSHRGTIPTFSVCFFLLSIILQQLYFYAHTIHIQLQNFFLWKCGKTLWQQRKMSTNRFSKKKILLLFTLISFWAGHTML